MVRPIRAVTRSRSCSAALRENVSASTWSGRAPRPSMRSTIASTSVVVLPVPGPASTSSGPPAWSTTRCWCSSRVGTVTARSGRTRWKVVSVAVMWLFDHLAPTAPDNGPVSQRSVAILAFDDMEVLDFAGPYEVFNVAGELGDGHPFSVFSVGLTDRPAVGRGGFTVLPTYTLEDAPLPDVVVVPGGAVTRPLLVDERLLGWLREG